MDDMDGTQSGSTTSFLHTYLAICHRTAYEIMRNADKVNTTSNHTVDHSITQIHHSHTGLTYEFFYHRHVRPTKDI